MLKKIIGLGVLASISSFVFAQPAVQNPTIKITFKDPEHICSGFSGPYGQRPGIRMNFSYEAQSLEDPRRPTSDNLLTPLLGSGESYTVPLQAASSRFAKYTITDFRVTVGIECSSSIEFDLNGKLGSCSTNNLATGFHSDTPEIVVTPYKNKKTLPWGDVYTYRLDCEVN
jgi:hypothetical protein